MNVSKSEALDMLMKWHDESTSIRCQMLLRQFTAAFTARVYSVSESKFVLASEDLRTELNVPLGSELTFGYGDARQAPVNDTPYDACLIVFLEPIPSVRYPDLISLSEFREE